MVSSPRFDGQQHAVAAGAGGASTEDDRADSGASLCRRFTDALPVSGASISVVSASGNHCVVGASDALAVEVEAWQFQAGVGPHWEALRTGQPASVHVSAVGPRPSAWPMVISGAGPEGVGALSSFPLQLGARVVGVADLHGRAPVGAWSDETVTRARRLAHGVTAAAVRLATRSAIAPRSRTGRNAVELRREMHQAAGILMAQLDCSAETAMLRLRAQSFASGVPLNALTHAVVTRTIDFSLL